MPTGFDPDRTGTEDAAPADPRPTPAFDGDPQAAAVGQAPAATVGSDAPVAGVVSSAGFHESPGVGMQHLPDTSEVTSPPVDLVAPSSAHFEDAPARVEASDPVALGLPAGETASPGGTMPGLAEPWPEAESDSPPPAEEAGSWSAVDGGDPVQAAATSDAAATWSALESGFAAASAALRGPAVPRPAGESDPAGSAQSRSAVESHFVSYSAATSGPAPRSAVDDDVESASTAAPGSAVPRPAEDDLVPTSMPGSTPDGPAEMPDGPADAMPGQWVDPPRQARTEAGRYLKAAALDQAPARLAPSAGTADEGTRRIWAAAFRLAARRRFEPDCALPTISRTAAGAVHEHFVAALSLLDVEMAVRDALGERVPVAEMEPAMLASVHVLVFASLIDELALDDDELDALIADAEAAAG